MINVMRFIRFYSRQDETLVGEIMLSEYSLSDLQALFSCKIQNPMYDCYEIDKEKSKHFSKLLTFNFDKYDYFLECDTL